MVFDCLVPDLAVREVPTATNIKFPNVIRENRREALSTGSKY